MEAKQIKRVEALWDRRGNSQSTSTGRKGKVLQVSCMQPLLFISAFSWVIDVNTRLDDWIIRRAPTMVQTEKQEEDNQQPTNLIENKN